MYKVPQRPNRLPRPPPFGLAKFGVQSNRDGTAVLF